MNSAPGERQRGEHRLADRPGRVAVLLGERGDAVEAEEAQDRDRGRPEHQLQREVVAVVDRREVEAATLAARQRDDRDDDEDRQHEQLAEQHDLVDPGGELDAEVVHDGVEDDEDDQPHPDRDRRPDRVHRDRGDQVQQRRHQHVVEQDHPAAEEPDPLVDAAPGVGVDRAGHREGARHLRVRDGGERHRDAADRVGEGDHAAGGLEDAAEDAERRDRHHEDQAVDEQVGERQRPLELLLVAEGLDTGLAAGAGAVGGLGEFTGGGRFGHGSSSWRPATSRARGE